MMLDPQSNGNDYYNHPYKMSDLMLARTRTAKLLSYIGVEGGVKQLSGTELGNNDGYRGPALDYNEVPLSNFPEMKGLQLRPSTALEEALYQYQIAGPVKRFFAKHTVQGFLRKLTSLPDVPGLDPATQALRAHMNSVMSDPVKMAPIRHLLETGDLSYIDTLPEAPRSDGLHAKVTTSISYPQE